MLAANDSENNVIPFPGSQAHCSQDSSWGSPFAWIVWITSALFVLFQFALQLTSGVIVGGLMKSFSLSAFGGGLLASSYYYIYVCLQAPAGFLVDHYGTRRILSLGAAVCGLGCVLFATAPSFTVALMGRLLMGAGASFAFVGSMSLVSRWFPKNRFGFMAAIAESLGMIGTLLGGFVLAHAVQLHGWRVSMECAAGMALALALLLALIVRNAPKNIAPKIPQTKSQLWLEVKALLKKRVIWLNGLYSSAIFGGVTVFVALWGVPFIQKLHHLSLAHATLFCNLVYIGVAIGAPLFGWLDNHIRSRRIILATSAFVSCISLCLMIYDPVLSLWMLALCMLLLGVAVSSYILNFVISGQVATENTKSTAIGLTNMMSVASAPLFQPVVGLVLYLLARHASQTNLGSYTIVHFQLALLIVPSLSALAMIVAFCLPNRPS